MTYRYSFAIGSYPSDIANVESLITNPPYQESLIPTSVNVEGADGLRYGHGWGTVEWRWGFISQADRNVLKAFCPNDSDVVYIRTKDANGNWVYCQAIMDWPIEDEEPAISGRILDLRVPFKIVENLGATT